MFKIRHCNRIVTVENILQRSNSKLTDSNYKLYQQFQQKHKYYYKSSFFPAFLGLSTLTIFSAGFSYHYSEDVREKLRPYLSRKSKIFLDDYLGPHNFSRLKRKFADLGLWPSLLNKTDNENSELEDVVIKMDINPLNTNKISELNSDAVKDGMKKEVDRIFKLNEELSIKISDQMTEIENLSTNAVLHLMEYENKIQQHNDKLRRAIEVDESTTINPWEDVSHSNNLMEDAKSKTDKELQKFESSVRLLQKIIDDATNSSDFKSNTSIQTGLKFLTDTNYRVQQKQADIEKARFNAQITNDYKELIYQSRERFKKELASLSPNVSNWTKKKTDKLSNEDLNAMIIHAHRRMNQLQARIAELEAMEVVRLEAALKAQREQDEQLAIEKVNQELEKERFKLSMERESDNTAMKEKYEEELRNSLVRQALAHSEHVNQLLKIQREEVERKHEMMLREALLNERDRMRSVIDGWRSRVEGLEFAVEGRADEERISREAQDMWVACHALHGVLTGTGVTPPLTRYLASFEEAAQPSSMPIVSVFLNSVPKSAMNEGVCTQQLLIKRFEKIKTICRRVAMIDETSGSLPMYLMSWLRSLFMMTPAHLIESQTEIDPVNDVIDTHQIIASAELAIWRQDIDLAVRLLNMLVGMPRCVAHDWIIDARVYLETKLAAEALSSYTSSKTAGSIPQTCTKPLEP